MTALDSAASPLWVGFTWLGSGARLKVKHVNTYAPGLLPTVVVRCMYVFRSGCRVSLRERAKRAWRVVASSELSPAHNFV